MPGQLPEDFNGVGQPRTPKKPEEGRRSDSDFDTERRFHLPPSVHAAVLAISFAISVWVGASLYNKFAIKHKEDKPKIVVPEELELIKAEPSIAAMPEDVTRAVEDEALADQIKEKEESIKALLLQMKEKGDGEGFVFKEDAGFLVATFRDRVGRVGIKMGNSADTRSFTLNTASVGYDNSSTWDFLVDDDMDGRGLMEMMTTKAADGTEKGTLDANPENRQALFLQKLIMIESYLKDQLRN